MSFFFRQTRIGLHGKVFTMYKLRTMRDPQPGEDPMATDALRLTCLGRFLRATRVDELMGVAHLWLGLFEFKPDVLEWRDR